MMERTETMRRRLSMMGMVDRRTFICLLASLAVSQAHVALTFPPARYVGLSSHLPIVLKTKLDLPSSQFSPSIVGQISILGLADLFPREEC